MTAIELNHASVVAHELAESVAFYEELFGMEPVPTPTFEVPVQWLRCGEQQLHLFERDVSAPEYHHLGLTVDDFDRIYREATERALFAGWDDSTDGSLYLLPDGVVQLYLADPAGNLVEVDHPDVTSLSDEIRADIVDREELEDQNGEAARASLEL
jgi:catechol 2,3-dioxygenase-like lactoylglutathione lyase family enzyme